MAELFRFRCSGCAKLLGVSPRKVGRSVACPQCGTDLIVPSPDDTATENPDDSGDDFADLGIDLGFGSPLAIRPPERSPADRLPVEDEASAFLGKIAEMGLTEPEPSPTADNPEHQPDDPGAPDDEPDAEEEPLVATPAEPLVARSRRPRPSPATFDRRRDVNLPRTAVILWALFALFSLALSFVAGLMIGHYRWR